MVEFLVFYADGTSAKIMAKDMQAAAQVAGEGVVGIKENRGMITQAPQPQGRTRLPARMQEITDMVSHVAREALAPIITESLAPFRQEMQGIREHLGEGNKLRRQQVQRAGGALSEEDWSEMEANASIIHRRKG